MLSSQSRDRHPEHQNSVKMYKESESSLKRVLCGHKGTRLLRRNKIQKSLHQFREWVGGPANLAVGSTGTGLAAEKLVIIPSQAAVTHGTVCSFHGYPDLILAMEGVLYSSLSVLEWGEQTSLWFSGHGFLKAELSLPEICVWKNLIGEFLELQAKQ